MATLALAAGAALLAPAGCGAPAKRVELDLATDRVSVVVPEGYRVVDYGQRKLLRTDSVELVITSLGPYGPAAIRHDILRARAYWRDGKRAAADWALRVVSVENSQFATKHQRDDFWETWRIVVATPTEAAFDALLAKVAALPMLSDTTLMANALGATGLDERRDATMRRKITIGGLPGVAIDTWNRLSHVDRQRFAFVQRDGYVLALFTERGAY